MVTQPSRSSIEDLGNGVKREWLHGNRILVFTITTDTMVRETVDTWAAGVIEAIRRWPDEKVMLLMHDARHVEFSSYYRHKVDEVNRATPRSLHGRTAVVVQRGMLGYFLSTLAQTTGRLFRGRIETKVFFDREEGLNWLRELL